MGPRDSFLLASDIFYRLEKVTRIGLHLNIWVPAGERVESVPPAPACCPDVYAEEGTSEKAYCLNKKALHVPKLS